MLCDVCNKEKPDLEEYVWEKSKPRLNMCEDCRRERDIVEADMIADMEDRAAFALYDQFGDYDEPFDEDMDDDLGADLIGSCYMPDEEWAGKTLLEESLKDTLEKYGRLGIPKLP